MLTKNKTKNIERLLYLADEVEQTLPDRKVGNRPPFYFGSYADACKWDGKNQQLTCGTTACAIGLASTLPKFRKLGLRLKLKKDWCGGDTVQPYIEGGDHENDEYSSYVDVAIVLGLTVDEYLALFTPDSSPAYLSDHAEPQEVADNIRSFCAAAENNRETDWLEGESEDWY